VEVGGVIDGFDGGVELKVGEFDFLEGGVGHDGSLGVSCSPSRHAHVVDSWDQLRLSLPHSAQLGALEHRGFATRTVGSSPVAGGVV
jgi:hypothetical protein